MVQGQQGYELQLLSSKSVLMYYKDLLSVTLGEAKEQAERSDV